MNEIITGDCREVMRGLIAEGVKVQMCVTSPPYWGLRDYGVAGQLGLESTPQEYVANMVDVFRLVRELLADDGTLWLNLGDSYASQGGLHDGREDNQLGVGAARVWRDGSGRADGIVDARGQRNRNGNRVPSLKPKDLCGIPWRVAFALQADGWYLRQDIIWSKPNPMPESVRDRCTKAHEYLFLLSKRERYWCDMDAIVEESETKDGRKPYLRGQVDYRGNGHDRGGGDDRIKTNRDQDGRWNTDFRNKRSVWTIATQPYAEAHFATFPPALIEPCILAGSRAGDIVFDPFMGSGTTGEVAQRLGRNWLGCELNPEYVKLAEKRTGGTIGMQFTQESA